jgi:ReqiPepy6 Gp37-like protein
MRLDELTVEVRNRNLDRVGQIRPEDLNLQAEDDFNNVGAWTLTVAVEHPLAGALRTPGAGLIVTGPSGVLFSGPVTESQSEATVTDPIGTLQIHGVTDSVLLMDSLAYADPNTYNPGRPFPWSTGAVEDKRTGPVETLMHQFVSANIGPAAPVQRREGTLLERITMGANGGRGPTTTKSAKYDQLGKLLTDLAATASLGFRVVQRGSSLVFETYAVRDRTDVVRLDIFNSTLAGHKVIVGPPGATRVLVQGKDLLDGTLPVVIRNFVVSTTDASLAAEAEWGRRIEVFKDDSSQDSVQELDQAGQEELAREGFTSLAVQAVPMDDSSMPYGRTWQLGDKIAVVVEDQELVSTVSGYVLKADAGGVRLGALAGDPTGFNRVRATTSRISRVESRVSALERTTAATAATTAVMAQQAATQLATLPIRMATGRATITPVANTPTWLAVSFPAGRFTAAPNVVITADEQSPQVVDVSVTQASPTGFFAWIYKNNTSTTFLHWIAIQPF